MQKIFLALIAMSFFPLGVFANEDYKRFTGKFILVPSSVSTNLTPAELDAAGIDAMNLVPFSPLSDKNSSPELDLEGFLASLARDNSPEKNWTLLVQVDKDELDNDELKVNGRLFSNSETREAGLTVEEWSITGVNGGVMLMQDIGDSTAMVQRQGAMGFFCQEIRLTLMDDGLLVEKTILNNAGMKAALKVFKKKPYKKARRTKETMLSLLKTNAVSDWDHVLENKKNATTWRGFYKRSP